MGAERGYTMVAMIVGGSFYGYIVGTITAIVSRLDLNESTYQERMDVIQAWADHHHLPRPLRRSLRHHFEQVLNERSAAAEAEIFHDLSPELQHLVAEYVLHDDVKYNPLFDGMPVGVVARMQCIVQ